MKAYGFLLFHPNFLCYLRLLPLDVPSYAFGSQSELSAPLCSAPARGLRRAARRHNSSRKQGITAKEKGYCGHTQYPFSHFFRT